MLEATGGWRWFYGLIEDGKASTDAAEVEGEVIDSIREAGIPLAAQSAFFRTDRGPDQLKSKIGLARQKDTSKYPSPHQMRGSSIEMVAT